MTSIATGNKFPPQNGQQPQQQQQGFGGFGGGFGGYGGQQGGYGGGFGGGYGMPQQQQFGGFGGFGGGYGGQQGGFGGYGLPQQQQFGGFGGFGGGYGGQQFGGFGGGYGMPQQQQFGGFGGFSGYGQQQGFGNTYARTLPPQQQQGGYQPSRQRFNQPQQQPQQQQQPQPQDFHQMQAAAQNAALAYRGMPTSNEIDYTDPRRAMAVSFAQPPKQQPQAQTNQPPATPSQLYDTLRGMGGGSQGTQQPQPQQREDYSRPQVSLREPMRDAAQEANQKLQAVRSLRRQSMDGMTPMYEQFRSAQGQSGMFTPREELTPEYLEKMYADGGAVGQAPTTQQTRQENPRMQAMRSIQQLGNKF